jgi:hypothetical protein
MNLPSDSFMLFSAINMKLRDEYSSLSELCNSEDIDERELRERLAAAGFEYLESANQFR